MSIEKRLMTLPHQISPVAVSLCRKAMNSPEAIARCVCSFIHLCMSLYIISYNFMSEFCVYGCMCVCLPRSFLLTPLDGKTFIRDRFHIGGRKYTCGGRWSARYNTKTETETGTATTTTTRLRCTYMKVYGRLCKDIYFLLTRLSL